jgi:enterochelin esterase family protein
MPEWQMAENTIERQDIPKGTLSGNIAIKSNETNLDYTVNYRVYLPANYQNVKELPVLYVTDGHEYANSLNGSMITVLDNLIATNRIKPVIAVFIDPRNPENQEENRRLTEYAANDRFTDFLAHELVPEIDKNYKTSQLATDRAILGTSYGAWISTYVGVRKSEIFGLVAAQSPAFNQDLIREYGKVKKLPLKIFMSCGTIFDGEENTRLMRDVLIYKGYPLEYIEVNESHSWGAWRAQIDQILIYFFRK